MRNITLFLLLLAAGISYSQVIVKYNPDTDRISVDVYKEQPPFEIDQTEYSVSSVGDYFIYRNDYWTGNDFYIYHQAIVFDDYGKEIIYSETKRIINNGKTIIKANGKYFRGIALTY